MSKENEVEGFWLNRNTGSSEYPASEWVRWRGVAMGSFGTGNRGLADGFYSGASHGHEPRSGANRPAIAFTCMEKIN